MEGTTRAAHHPVPRGGRPAGRPDRRRRPRQGHRRRHAGGAQGRAGGHRPRGGAVRPRHRPAGRRHPRPAGHGELPTTSATSSSSRSTTGPSPPWRSCACSTTRASPPAPSPSANPASTTCSCRSPATGPRGRSSTTSNPTDPPPVRDGRVAGGGGRTGGHAVTTGTITVPTARPVPIGRGIRNHLRWGIADTLTVTRRNLLAYTRVPEALFFATVQPIMFVLLFRYVFAGAINVPGGRALRRLPDAGHLRADRDVRHGLHQHRPGRGPAEGHHRAVQGAADGPTRRC